MRPFTYTRATDAAGAAQAVSTDTRAKFLAGGTNLVDLMKEDVERPSRLVDITRLPLRRIAETADGLSLGALATNAETANHPLVRRHYPLLAQAILSGASAQIRNMATNGGNLLQRTRCSYFYETAAPCNKREPGSGCSAREGFNGAHALFGWSEQCVAVHPSDMCVALVALDAAINVMGADGRERALPIEQFHRLPGTTPHEEHALRHGELVTSIVLPSSSRARRSCYLKLRDRASYAFALVSVAAALEMDGRTIANARLALGGVAHKPWRATEAERILVGQPATEQTFLRAAEAAMADARPLAHNGFKIELGRSAIVRALTQAADDRAAQARMR